MSIEKQYNIIKWGIVFLIALFSIFLLYLNIKMPFVLGDDFLYALKFPDQGFIGSATIDSFSSYINSQINHYNNYNNRIAPHGLLQLVLLLPTFFFDFINVIVFLILPWLIVEPFVKTKREKIPTNLLSKNIVLYFLVLLFLWCFHYDLGRSYLWTTGSVNYSWFLVFQLMYVGRLYKSLFDNFKLKIGTVLIAFLICTTNENVVLSLFVVTTAVLIYKKYIVKMTVEKPLILSALVLLFGGLLMLKSPALAERFENESFGFDSFFDKALEYSKRQLYYGLCALSAFLFLLSYKWKFFHKGKLIYFGSIIIISSLIMVMAPLYEPRSSIFSFFMFIMLVMSYLDLTSNRNNLLLFLFLIFGIVVIPSRVNQVNNVRSNYDKNIQIVNAQETKTKLQLSKFCSVNNQSVAVCDELSYSADEFENKILASYLKKESVVLAKDESDDIKIKFLNSYKQLSANSENYTYKKVGKQLTEGFSLSGVYLNEKEMIFELKSASKVSDLKSAYYILRGSNKKSWKHKFVDLLPLSIATYFLDYLEEEIVVIDSDRILLHCVFDVNDYSSFIFSLYDKKNHNTFGEYIFIEDIN